ncbi:hypothetical protein OG361_04135 [Streptomyces sp. NBC_00090]|uniref:hypothetical protein n=1 Tax=Streptomyces sp. NBC_00090 TaxID=2903619 RepID=UPI0032483B43
MGARQARDGGVHAGQRVAPLVEGPQHAGGVPQVPVADEVPLGPLIRVQHPLVVGEEPGAVHMVVRQEGMPGKRLPERGDLRLDPG